MKMRTYDVTLTISPSMPVWPGDPGVSLGRVQKIEEGSLANVSRIEMGVHTGTHVDAPYHFIKDGSTVESLSLKTLIGRAYVVHLDDSVERVLPSHLEAAGIPPRTQRVLIRTRNSKHWAKGEYKAFDESYVGVDESAAKYLVERGVKLVGVDYLSVAPFPEPQPTHVTLLSAGVVIVEGLNLSQVAQGRYNFWCLPLKLDKTDGAPARVVLQGV
ncbi:MAG TPA: cyclase family protein [Anaerolineales bacterium]|nr:cyclase family protein [Anaerolineales bacterium]HRQ91340.1 cyclase family protein [Anaerolineales bacterium]